MPVETHHKGVKRVAAHAKVPKSSKKAKNQRKATKSNRSKDKDVEDREANSVERVLAASRTVTRRLVLRSPKQPSQAHDLSGDDDEVLQASQILPAQSAEAVDLTASPLLPACQPPLSPVLAGFNISSSSSSPSPPPPPFQYLRNTPLHLYTSV